MRFWRLLALVAILMSPLRLLASDIDYNTAHLDRRLPAVRTTDRIVVDGRLDEPAWATAPVAKEFIQNDPKEGQPASEDTEVRILYDDQNLYIGVFAHQQRLDDIIVSDLKKDFNLTSGDVFAVVLDTFHDQRNAYSFSTNPKGAKWDAQMINEGREQNVSWDAVWSVQTQIIEGGWYAEIAIPFRTLRFPDVSPQTWGINFMRRMRGRWEDTYWAPLQRVYNINRVSLAGTLENLQGIHPGADFRLKPYALANVHDAASGARSTDASGGFDVKYGLKTNLLLDFTMNTDFSQVEADEQQINLTRFSLLFPEKRDFFLENSGAFQFGPAPDRPGPAVRGRMNRVNDELDNLFFSRRIGISDDGVAIPIVAGARLTGHAGPFTIGALNIQQRSLEQSPATNFTALRLRRDILANSDVGVMVLNKAESGGNSNRVVGSDANFRFGRDFNIGGFAAKSFDSMKVGGKTGADTTTSVRMTYNSNRWDIRLANSIIGEQFNDESGFVPRTGFNKFSVRAGRRLRFNALSRIVREFSPHFEMYNYLRPSGDFESRYIDYHIPFNFQDGTNVETGWNTDEENLLAPFTLNSRRRIVVPPGEYRFAEFFALTRTDPSKPVSVIGRYSTGTFWNGTHQQYNLYTTIRANERFNTTISWARNDVTLPVESYSTDLLSARINLNFSTRTFLNAFLQYNTDARQWTSNIRFNIIHHTLSDFFLVYNERRDSQTGVMQDRAVIAKITHMMAF